MVDVSAKDVSVRLAVAAGVVRTTQEVVALLRRDGLPKGDALGVARIAGIQGAKRTADLIPLCHPIALTSVRVTLEPEGDETIVIEASVRCIGRTGVEMEAMTAVSVAALALYDMLKAIDRGITIESIALVEKRGGKSGDYVAP